MILKSLQENIKENWDATSLFFSECIKGFVESRVAGRQDSNSVLSPTAFHKSVIFSVFAFLNVLLDVLLSSMTDLLVIP